MIETTYQIDWSQVASKVIQGLNDGSMKLSASNGNVYWAKGSGHSGIVDQLPFVPTGVDGSNSLLQSVQAIQPKVPKCWQLAFLRASYWVP